MLSLLVAVPTALAAWQEGGSTDWWYVDANYLDYHSSGPLVIEINGDSTPFQVFHVGDTISITGHLYAVAQSCAGTGNGAYTEWALEVNGPSGSDSVADFNYDQQNASCAQADENTTLTITYTLTAPGDHTVSMESYAAVSQYWADVADDYLGASLTFMVVEYDSVGDCISTRIDTQCDGLRGRDRASCVTAQIGYCHEYYDVPSAHNTE